MSDRDVASRRFKEKVVTYNASGGKVVETVECSSYGQIKFESQHDPDIFNNYIRIADDTEVTHMADFITLEKEQGGHETSGSSD